MILAKRRFRRACRRHVVVHLREGVSLEGVLSGLYADSVTLSAASVVRADDYDTPLAGEQIVPWASILWAQELSDATSDERLSLPNP